LFSAAKTVTKVRLDFVPPSHPFFKASDNPMKIRKAVFPVAGLGTRVLPATKAMPKEMLTIVDKPLIQYVVDEAREAGIEHFVFVTGRNKGVIEDHFDRMFELDTTLAQRGKKTEQEMVRDLRHGIRHFAKRQMTWFRGLPRRGIEVTWVGSDDHDLLLNHRWKGD